MRILAVFLLAACAFAQENPCSFRPGTLSRSSCLSSAAPSLVAGESPFSPDCNGSQSGTNYRNTSTEPWVAVDPKNPLHIVGAWQQDRWADGGSSGLLNGASFDGGRRWTLSSAHFSTCTGGSYDRASDPWIAFSPDGSVHQISLSVSNGNTISAMLVAKSTDGGLSWTEPTTLIQDGPGAFNDKESIAADPFDSNYVYAVW